MLAKYTKMFVKEKKEEPNYFGKQSDKKESKQFKAMD